MGEGSEARDIDAADWVDEDLLTRQEAGERLGAAIEVTEARLAELETLPSEDPSTAEAVRMVRRRLVAMRNRRDAL